MFSYLEDRKCGYPEYLSGELAAPREGLSKGYYEGSCIII